MIIQLLSMHNTSGLWFFAQHLNLLSFFPALSGLWISGQHFGLFCFSRDLSVLSFSGHNLCLPVCISHIQMILPDLLIIAFV